MFLFLHFSYTFHAFFLYLFLHVSCNVPTLILHLSCRVPTCVIHLLVFQRVFKYICIMLFVCFHALFILCSYLFLLDSYICRTVVLHFSYMFLAVFICVSYMSVSSLKFSSRFASFIIWSACCFNLMLAISLVFRSAALVRT